MSDEDVVNRVVGGDAASFEIVMHRRELEKETARSRRVAQQASPLSAEHLLQRAIIFCN